MSALRKLARDYLAMRRRLGFKLQFLDSLLDDFVGFVEAKGSSIVTTALCLEWATRIPEAKAITATRRLGIARRFAQHCAGVDGRNEVPPRGMLSFPYHRPYPYIYRDEEIRRLMTAAATLPSIGALDSHTYRTLFGLLAVTGLRRCEAIALNRADVDLKRCILTIRRTKFGKSRLVLIHRSTKDALAQYSRRRDLLQPGSSEPSFFVSNSGARLDARHVNRAFSEVLRIAGIGGQKPQRGPRLHDLRHTFVVRTLVRWYRAGADVNRLMPVLATYVGHVRVQSTYWYISAVPELLRLAVRRLEQGGPCHADPRRLPRTAGGILYGPPHAPAKGQSAYYRQL